MERELRRQKDTTHNFKAQEPEIGRQGGGGESGSRRHSSKSAGETNGISEELWKAFLIEEEFSTVKLSTPKEKESVEDMSSSSDDQDSSAYESDNDEISETSGWSPRKNVTDGTVVEQLNLKEELDKHLVNTFLSYEMMISSTGKVDHEQVEACKKLIGKDLTPVVGLQYKGSGSWQNETGYISEVSWMLLSRAVGFGAGRIPCIPWPAYSRTDARLNYDRTRGYSFEGRCPYASKWNTAQISKF